jgi:hypothetical protein
LKLRREKKFITYILIKKKLRRKGRKEKKTYINIEEKRRSLGVKRRKRNGY